MAANLQKQYLYIAARFLEDNAHVAINRDGAQAIVLAMESVISQGGLVGVVSKLCNDFSNLLPFFCGKCSVRLGELFTNDDSHFLLESRNRKSSSFVLNGPSIFTPRSASAMA